MATAEFEDREHGKGSGAGNDVVELLLRATEAEDEVAALRRRLVEHPRRVELLEEKLLETKGQLAQAISQNEKLTITLQTAKEHIAALRDEVEKLTQPPAAYGTFLGRNDDGTVDVFSGGRKMRVAVHPDIDADDVKRGDEVVLNESLNVVLAREGESSGEVVVLKDLLEGGTRAVVYGRADEERVVQLSDALVGAKLRAGDSVLMEVRTGLLIEKLPRPEVEELVLEEVPDVTYGDVGGLDDQIEAITDAVELPYLYRELYAEMSPFRQRVVYEGHPELSFYQINGDVPLRYSKLREEGREERRSLLEKRIQNVHMILNADIGVPEKHFYDAVALMWTARRVNGKAAKRIPGDAEWDSEGLRTEYVY
jgi:SpoVK/Ycf46/Vps4 family AAA+-type ATPase